MQDNITRQMPKRTIAFRFQKFYFDLSYKFGFAEWDVNKAQPDLINLVKQGKINGQKILDIGCGSGDNAIYLAKQGFEVTGIDYAKKGIQLAKSRAEKSHTSVDFLVGDAFNLSWLNYQFDTVIDYGLYHNIPLEKLDKYLSSVEQVIKPNGLFIIQSFGENAPKSNFGPRQVTENELKNVFKDRWQIQEIFPAIFHNTSSTKIPAILAIIKLKNK
jgi:2-polyprenyl-3-methyl-5-hydroxy-6-metoxy-1,4-benzoquinol methylase